MYIQVAKIVRKFKSIKSNYIVSFVIFGSIIFVKLHEK